MSTSIGFNYGGKPEPSPVFANFALRVDGNTIRAETTGMGDFVFKLTPHGNIGESVLSGAAWPVAQSAAVMAQPLAKSLVEGVHVDVVTLHPVHHEVYGQKVIATPTDLSISTDGDMLTLTASVQVSTPGAFDGPFASEGMPIPRGGFPF